MDDKYNEAGIPVEIEADGFITPIHALESGLLKDLKGNVSLSTAQPMTECMYPLCEDCYKYHGKYCTVPMVVSKQIWLTTESLITRMEKRLTELEMLVTDEILRSDDSRVVRLNDHVNYTWDDYLGEDK